MTDYHTAIGRDMAGRWPALEHFDGRHGSAFRADLSDGIPGAMMQADVWYADLPWREGFTKFAERAGVTQARPYDELLRDVGRQIRESGKPAVMVTGVHAVRMLNPEAVAQLTLNGGSATACLWGLPAWSGTRDAVAVLEDLAARFKCVGDFCCGYGRAGRIFAQAGRRYILSDFNAECIGYIAAHEKDWTA